MTGRSVKQVQLDREKVMRGLECCSTHIVGMSCGNCPYEIEQREDEGISDCTSVLAYDALALLQEQETVQWINVNDKLPEKDGQYLVVYTFFDYRSIGVVRFSHNLHKIDKYIFDTERRPGWYEPDDEVGYFERTTVTHWAKLPEFPKEG